MALVGTRLARTVCRVYVSYLVTGDLPEGRRLARLMGVLYLMDLIQNPYFPVAI